MIKGNSLSIMRSVSPSWTPQIFETPPFTLINDFDNLDDLTLSVGDQEVVIDNTIFLEGTGSLKVTTHTNSLTIDFALPNVQFDVNAIGILRLYLPVVAVFSSCTFFVSKTTNYLVGTYASGPLTAYEGIRDQATFKSGWNNIQFNRASFTSGTPTLLDDPANVFIQARITIIANKGPVYFDSLKIGSLIKSNILVMFDDASDTIMAVNDAVFGAGKSAFDYMNDNNIHGTIYVISDAVDGAYTLTTSQAREAYNKGWDLGNHTKTHAILTALNDAQITSELSDCNTFLQSHGWNRRLHFAYPTGAFTLDTHPALVKALGYKSGRSIQTYLLNTQYKPDNLFHLWAKGVSSIVTAANITDKVDESVLTGRMFAIYIHALGTPESASLWDPAKFKIVIDYLVTKRTAGLINILTMSEWENSLIKL